MKLEDTLAKTITDFCGNGFTNAGDNHCAHFVCHVLQLSIGYTCRAHTGGTKPGACVRVHELFEVCPEVGFFSEEGAAPRLVFVTAEDNVDLQKHKMRNVPQKHVGIYDGNFVYNYSNGQDVVVRQTSNAFLQRFQTIYSGNQKLFTGTLPVGAVIPTSDELPVPDTFGGIVPEAVQTPSIVIRKEIAGGRTHFYSQVNKGAEFYLATDVKYEQLRGLYQPEKRLNGPQYKATEFALAYGTVAVILGVIAASESDGYFNRLNSYDRAAFTFGFFQLAAHTPNDNLILLFRAFAAEDTAFQKLFPDLSVRDGRLHRQVGQNYFVSLEKEYPRPTKPDELNLRDFMSYLNPDTGTVELTELEASARLIALANDAASGLNEIQVKVAAEITMRKIRRAYDPWYELDGKSDLLCTAIADIHHQGRGKKTEVRAALKENSLEAQVAALCDIGKANYATRCASLKSALNKAQTAGLLGVGVFDRASGVFRPQNGWFG